MLLKILRWIFGYMCIELTSGDYQKFINSCIKSGITMWDLKKENANLKLKIIDSDYELALKTAKKSNCEVFAVNKVGMPYCAAKYRKRFGLLAGGAVFVFIIYFLSLYVWSVKVSGNETIPAQAVISAMSELGVKPGTFKKNIDAPIIEQLAMKKLENVAWMSVNIKGSTVSVLIKEKTIAPKINFQSKPPCNIVAKEDAQIERLETYRGEPCAAAGDVVVKGQLLISGIVESPDLKSTFLNAEGKVFAKVNRKFTERIKLECTELKDTGKIIKKCRIKGFGLEIPIDMHQKINGDFRCENSDEFLKIFGAEIPIKIYKEKWYEQEKIKVIMNLQQAEAQAENNLKSRENEELSGVQIVERKPESREESGEYIKEITYVCLEDIAQQEPIFFETRSE